MATVRPAWRETLRGRHDPLRPGHWQDDGFLRQRVLKNASDVILNEVKHPISVWTRPFTAFKVTLWYAFQHPHVKGIRKWTKSDPRLVTEIIQEQGLCNGIEMLISSLPASPRQAHDLLPLHPPPLSPNHAPLRVGATPVPLSLMSAAHGEPDPTDSCVVA